MTQSKPSFLPLSSSLRLLYRSFPPSAAIGIGYEMQPVYRHCFWNYRNNNKGTKVGEAVVNGGNPGFNSGVLLLDLEKLRNSHLFDFFNQVRIENLTSNTKQSVAVLYWFVQLSREVRH